jgi:hypothetical protein
MEKKHNCVLFFTRTQKQNLIHGKSSIFIDFHNTKKMELSCNTWKKKQSFFIFTKPQKMKSNTRKK